MSTGRGSLRMKLGAAVSSGPLARLATPLALGYLSALVAAMAYGVTQVLGKKLVTDFANPLVTATFTVLFGTLILSMFVGRQMPGEVKAAPRRSLLFIVLAGITSSAGLALMYAALTRAPVVVVSPIASLNPLMAIVLAHLFLKRMERITPPASSSVPSWCWLG